ncbi:hypothetical protein B0H66DRAFT_566662 [Apodospora peruviana]|uniref:Zn(2)-C6 fungal-type domain-containing protein n=1 Tax=Apodospora peruviana TaxID=516989 RepID=A0AAE0HW12_9PEZI|nr:hypothetical protein B0H66DRAFT_566662 [Apodospora peruviana]
MKRKISPVRAGDAGLSDSGYTLDQDLGSIHGHRKRQPQTSCDFCRQKKLKCDRLRPCSSCTARSRPCHGPPGAQQSPIGTASTVHSPHADATGHEILERLRKLEEAVFGNSPGSRGVDGSPSCPEPGEPQSTTGLGGQVLVANSELDNTDACGSLALAGDHCDAITYRIARPDPVLPTTSKTGLRDVFPAQTMHPTKRIWLPSQEGSLALLEDFLRGQHLFLGIIDPHATRMFINNVYACLQSPDNPKVRTARVALILAISATTAFFWDKNDHGLTYQFNSEADAARRSIIWRKSVLDLLDQARREMLPCLEEVQATVILSALVSQMEGCPSRYRRLQASALVTARELCMHLVDAPVSSPPWENLPEDVLKERGYEVEEDSEAIREVKRRVWWYLAGTDWLLSVMGGPLNRTYTVNPRHMNVRYPRNINDADLASIGPPPPDGTASTPNTSSDPPTQYTLHLLRIRLAEICYKIVDALQPLNSSPATLGIGNGNGGGNIEHLPYEQVLYLSNLFDDAFASFPPSFKQDASVPVPASVSLDARSMANIDIQRRAILLFFHARRARLFRPFLHYYSTPTNGISRDQRFDKFASICRVSARTVLGLASSLLGEDDGYIMKGTLNSNATNENRRRHGAHLVHRSGVIILHLFMACVILATDPTFLAGGGDKMDAEARRAELANACHLLQIAGERSAMALSLMENLLAVLQRHKVRVGHGMQAQTAAARRTKLADFGIHIADDSTISRQAPPIADTSIEMMGTEPPGFGQFNGTDTNTMNWDSMEVQMQETQQQQQPLVEGNWQPGQQLTDEPPLLTGQPLDGLWKDLVDTAAAAAGDRISDGVWDQMFADLDYLIGPS